MSASIPPHSRRAQELWELVVEIDPSLDKEGTGSAPRPRAASARAIAIDRLELYVGRYDEHADARPDIPVLDPGASRRHAKFVVDPDGSIALQDLASTNGTWVNGQVVPPGTRRKLAVGDAVTLGRWTRITLRGRT